MTLARVLCDNAHTELMTLEVFSRPAVYDHSVHGCISTLIPNMKFIGWFDKLEDNFFGIK